DAVNFFEAGRRAVEAGNCPQAIPRFRRSISIEPSVGARLNLAECSAKESRAADAWNQYKAAEELAIARKNPQNRKEIAQTAAAELGPKIVRVRMALPEHLDVRVKIDGEEIYREDYKLFATGYALDPEIQHTIEVSASQHSVWRRERLTG